MSHSALNESNLKRDPTQDELLDAAVKRYQESDFQTTFFFNFKPEGLEGETLRKVQDVISNVKFWQSWASGAAAVHSQLSINAGKLWNGTDGASIAKRSSYNSMVFDRLMRTSTWFERSKDENVAHTFQCKSVDFHKNLLNVVLDGFVVPGNVYKPLHDALSSIADNIKMASKKTDDQQMQYFIMLTKFEWQPKSETVQTVTRGISFRTDTLLTQYIVRKDEYTDVKLDFTYNLYQCNYLDEIFSRVREGLAGRLADGGATFMKDANTMDISIPSM